VSYRVQLPRAYMSQGLKVALLNEVECTGIRWVTKFTEGGFECQSKRLSLFDLRPKAVLEVIKGVELIASIQFAVLAPGHEGGSTYIDRQVQRRN
jgi:hypothetical protein